MRKRDGQGTEKEIGNHCWGDSWELASAQIPLRPHHTNVWPSPSPPCLQRKPALQSLVTTAHRPTMTKPPKLLEALSLPPAED